MNKKQFAVLIIGAAVVIFVPTLGAALGWMFGFMSAALIEYFKD
jgi:Flp pilus assembly pilin Flp